MGKYRVLQLTNNNISTVAENAFMPLGTITRKISCNDANAPTFIVSATGADTITLSEQGYYKIIYNASLAASAVGEVSIGLIVNGAQVYEVGETATAIGDVQNVTLSFIVRVLPNCSAVVTNNPMTLQFSLTGVGVSTGASNVTIERVY